MPSGSPTRREPSCSPDCGKELEDSAARMIPCCRPLPEAGPDQPSFHPRAPPPCGADASPALPIPYEWSSPQRSSFGGFHGHDHRRSGSDQPADYLEWHHSAAPHAADHRRVRAHATDRPLRPGTTSARHKHHRRQPSRHRNTARGKANSNANATQTLFRDDFHQGFDAASGAGTGSISRRPLSSATTAPRRPRRTDCRSPLPSLT